MEELYDFGQTNLRDNMKALEVAKGNVEQALNVLMDLQEEQYTLPPAKNEVKMSVMSNQGQTVKKEPESYLQRVDKVINAKLKNDLITLYLCNYRDFDTNKNAIIAA